MRKADAFPPRYFKAAEFGDTPKVFEIETVRHEKFPDNGKETEKPVVYFKGQKSGLVIGITVWGQIKEVTGSDDTEDWPGHRVELFKTETQFGRDMVDCIRVRAPGSAAKPKPKKKPASKKPDDPKPDFNDKVPY